jgi:hypothetical protein
MEYAIGFVAGCWFMAAVAWVKYLQLKRRSDAQLIKELQ